MLYKKFERFTHFYGIARKGNKSLDFIEFHIYKQNACLFLYLRSKFSKFSVPAAYSEA